MPVSILVANSLPRVHGEVLHHVVDGLQHRYAVALHDQRRYQPLGRERRDHGGCRVHGFAQVGAELRRGGAAARREFAVAVARVRQAADAADDPLTQVAAQVQHQVADGIFVLPATRPHLLRRELAKARLYARSQLA